MRTVMKQVTSVLLVLVMLLSPGLAPGENPEERDLLFSNDLSTKLTVGCLAPLPRNFFSERQNDNAGNRDIRQLLHSYHLVTWDTENSMYIMNPAVVSEAVVEKDDQENRKYRLILHTEMLHSNSNRITARDYAFACLLSMSQPVKEMSGILFQPDFIPDYNGCQDSQTPGLNGLRVLDDQTLMTTIRREILSLYNDLGHLDCVPYPMTMLAQGSTAEDEGNETSVYFILLLHRSYSSEIVEGTETIVPAYPDNPEEGSEEADAIGTDEEEMYFFLNIVRHVFGR